MKRAAGLPVARSRLGLVYFTTWAGEGSRASPVRGDVAVGGTTPARSFRAADGDVATDRVSEPETALPRRKGKQGAGAAHHRPRCNAPSWTPDAQSVAAGQGRGNENHRGGRASAHRHP